MEIGLRILATVLFWSAGIFGLFKYAVVVGEVKSVGLPFERSIAACVIATQLLGSAVFIFNPGNAAWAGAVLLAGFTVLTIPFGHAFWTFEEPRRTEEFHIVLEHLTVVGCLLLIGYYFA